MEESWVKIASFQQIQIADIAKAMLVDNDIQAVVISKQDSSYHLFGLHELYVNKSQEEQAKQLIEAADIND